MKELLQRMDQYDIQRAKAFAEGLDDIAGTANGFTVRYIPPE